MTAFKGLLERDREEREEREESEERRAKREERVPTRTLPARKQRTLKQQLGEQRAGTPDIHSGSVALLAQQELRRSIPQSNDLVRVLVLAHGASQTEIGDLQLALAVDQQVRGLEIAVNDAILVHKMQSGEELLRETLDLRDAEPAAIELHQAGDVVVHVPAT